MKKYPLIHYIFSMYSLYMALSDRMRIILGECGIKQKVFAKSINVTDSYISKLIRDECGMSNSTARLIEQLYGYSKDWIITGQEPKMLPGQERGLSALQKKIIMDVEQMNEAELRALLAFIEFLKKSMNQPYREREAR